MRRALARGRLVACAVPDAAMRTLGNDQVFESAEMDESYEVAGGQGLQDREVTLKTKILLLANEHVSASVVRQIATGLCSTQEQVTGLAKATGDGGPLLRASRVIPLHEAAKNVYRSEGLLAQPPGISFVDVAVAATAILGGLVTLFSVAVGIRGHFVSRPLIRRLVNVDVSPGNHSAEQELWNIQDELAAAVKKRWWHPSALSMKRWRSIDDVLARKQDRAIRASASRHSDRLRAADSPLQVEKSDAPIAPPGGREDAPSTERPCDGVGGGESPGHERRLLGQILVEHGKVSSACLGEALEVQKTCKRKIGALLIERCDITHDDVNEALAIQGGHLNQ